MVMEPYTDVKGPEPLNVEYKWEHEINVMISLRSHASSTFVKIKILRSIKFKPISIICALQMDITFCDITEKMRISRPNFRLRTDFLTPFEVSF